MGWFNKKELAEIERLKSENERLKERVKMLIKPSGLYDLLYSNTRSIYMIKKKKERTVADPFFTPSEYTLFNMLMSNLTERYFVFPKCKLMDIIDRWDDSKTWDNLISSKKTKLVQKMKDVYPDMDNAIYKRLTFYPVNQFHIDFLICRQNDEQNEIVPVLAIELDADNKKMKHGDKLKTAILDNISPEYKVGLWRIKNSELQDQETLKRKLINKLEAAEIA